MSERLRKPKLLRPRDRVALVAPSSRPFNPSELVHAVRVVEAMDFTPVIGKSVLNTNGHSAGTDEERAEDLNNFIRDETIAGIFCVNGGFGALPILDMVDLKALADSRKVFIGDDDNNSIGLALYAQENFLSFFGLPLNAIKDKVQLQTIKAALTNQNYDSNIEAVKFGDHGYIAEYVPVFGVAEGVLVGGNLTVLSSLLGTRFFPPLQDSVLFLCDSDERNDVMDRWLTSLYVSQKLIGVRGIIGGIFDNCGTKGSLDMISFEETFGERFRQLNIASRLNFPIAGRNIAKLIPIGVQVLFDATNGHLAFQETFFESGI